MLDNKTELERVERQVREGHERIAYQYGLINELRSKRYPTGPAEELLALFENLQRQNEDRLAELRKPL